MENNSTQENINDPERKDGEDYSIDTATIYHNEFAFVRDPEGYPWKKIPSDYDQQLEHLIQQLLVENLEPEVNYSDEKREYLIARYDRFYDAHFNIGAFHLHYFVVASDVPRKKNAINRLSFVGEKYYYLYGYDQHFIVKRRELNDDQFELLFAFALRQCDLMKIHSFLLHHLEWNFDGKVKQYCKYLTQLVRKFISIFFTPELADSIKDWITENETKHDLIVSKKIKTPLTVPKLAYLFRALAENKHLLDNTEQRIIQWACENFESKRMSEISPSSFHNSFYTHTAETLDYWAVNFDKMSKTAL